MVDSENRYKVFTASKSLPGFIIKSYKIFAMIYCRGNIIIVTGIYYTGFT
jgi:hypothetical protein